MSEHIDGAVQEGQAAPRFSDFWSEAQYTAHARHLELQPTCLSDAAGEEWHSRSTALDADLTTSIQRYLVALRDSSRLGTIPFTKGRHHRFADAWNSFVQEGPPGPWDMELISGPFSYQLNMGMRMLIPVPGQSSTPPAATTGAAEEAPLPSPYTKLCSGMDRGAFNSFHMGSDAACECSRTGQRLYVDIAPGWQPRLGVPDYSQRLPATPSGPGSYQFNALAFDAPPPEVIVHAIPTPTGEMLVSDWIRFDDRGFNAIVDVDLPKSSLEFEFGLAARTAHYAKLGFLSVFVSNTCPNVIRREDHLMIATLDDEVDAENEEAVVGRCEFGVCTDLWWVTMIDRKVLTDLLATKFGEDVARQKVDDLIASDDNVSILRVNPGTVFAHYATGPRGLAKFVCTDAAISTVGLEAPFVVLADRALSWERAQPAQQPETYPQAAPQAAPGKQPVEDGDNAVDTSVPDGLQDRHRG